MDNLPEKALSVRQPWAWLIVNGHKDFENRSKAALKHGMKKGPLCIHASKGMTQAEYDYVYKICLEYDIDLPRPDELVYGAIVGTVNVDSVHGVQWNETKWSFGPGLLLSDAKAITPIPSSGQLGYFKWKAGGKLGEIKKWMKNWNENSCGENHNTAEALPLFQVE